MATTVAAGSAAPMDAVSAKKLGILESLISISSDGSDISALVHSACARPARWLRSKSAAPSQ